MINTARSTVAAVMLVAAGAITGCASGSGGAGVLSETEVTAQDLAGTGYATVYEFIRAHARARFVNRRGQEYLAVYGGGSVRSSGITGAILVVDDQEVRGNVVPVLRQMPLSAVASLRILRASEASARYGGDGRMGAVVIRTREGGGA